MCNARDNQHNLPEWSAQEMVLIVIKRENVIYSPKDVI